MKTVIAFVDDADYAHRKLQPLKAAGPVHWVVVACAPQMTRRAGKWASQSSRQHWRARWCDKLFAGLAPLLAGEHDQLTQVVAKQALHLVTRDLLATHGDCRVVDARRPKFDAQPQAADEAPRMPWQGPGSLMGFGAALLLAFD